jgi:2-methylcitrate dehydratase
MDRTTRTIADFAAGLTFSRIDEAAVYAATQRIIDSIGCAMGAHRCEGATIGRRLAAGQTPGKRPGRVLFYGDNISVEMAAFVNTAMIRRLDFNDRYPGGHPSDCLGALFALSGATDTDGKQLLTSVIVAYEIFARLSDSARLSRRGWDQGYAIGISTAAGVCNFLNLPADQTAHAIGIAATSNLPLRVTRSGELTPWKNVATAYATRNGVFAALLASEGMPGPLNAFEGRNGLWENVTGQFELEPFPDAGGRALTPKVQLKYWPVETNGQPVIWAALELRSKVSWEEVEGIEVFTSKFTWFEIGSEPEKWDPQTAETADHSLPYIFARTLVSGMINAGSFADQMVREPLLRPLMAKIKVTIDDAIEALLPRVMLRVVAKVKDGREYQVVVDNPRGHPDNPMNDEDISTKFLSLCEPVVGKERSTYTLERLWHVKDADDFAGLLQQFDLTADTTRVGHNSK